MTKSYHPKIYIIFLILHFTNIRDTFVDHRLAANWPPVMQIVRLISQDHMNNKYVFISICIILIYIGVFRCILFLELCSVVVLIVYVVTRQYVGKADFLVFRAMNPHGFLGQLQEKKLVGSL